MKEWEEKNSLINQLNEKRDEQLARNVTLDRLMKLKQIAWVVVIKGRISREEEKKSKK